MWVVVAVLALLISGSPVVKTSCSTKSYNTTLIVHGKYLGYLYSTGPLIIILHIFESPRKGTVRYIRNREENQEIAVHSINQGKEL